MHETGAIPVERAGDHSAAGRFVQAYFAELLLMSPDFTAGRKPFFRRRPEVDDEGIEELLPFEHDGDAGPGLTVRAAHGGMRMRGAPERRDGRIRSQIHADREHGIEGIKIAFENDHYLPSLPRNYGEGSGGIQGREGRLRPWKFAGF